VPRLIGLEAAGMTLDSVPNESQFVVLKPGEAYSLIRVLTADIGADADTRKSQGPASKR
jgi:hypothetical protein